MSHRAFLRIVLILATFTASISAQFVVTPTNANGWHQNPNNLRWYRVGPPTDLAGARSLAAAWLGRLACITSAEDEAWINQTFLGGRMRIGLSDVVSEGSFVWESGDPVIYTNWSPGQPDNAGGENSVEILTTFSPSVWNDIPESLVMHCLIESDGFEVLHSSFDCDTVGPVTTPTCDGWTSTSAGVVQIIAGTAASASPSNGLFCASNNVQADSPTWPYGFDSVASAEVTTEVLGTQLAVSWHWTNGEGGAQITFNDFGELIVVDATTGALIDTVVRLDTFSATQAGTSSITLPASLVGTPVRIIAACGNVGDNSLHSTFQIDSLRFGLDAPFAGTDDDLLQRSGVSSFGPEARQGNAIFDAPGGSVVTIDYSTPSGTLENQEVLVLASLGVTGAPIPPVPFIPQLHIDLSTVFLMAGGGPLPLVARTFPQSFSFIAPGFLAGSSLMFQTLVPSAAAANGIFAVTDAHRADFK